MKKFILIIILLSTKMSLLAQSETNCDSVNINLNQLDISSEKILNEIQLNKIFCNIKKELCDEWALLKPEQKDCFFTDRPFNNAGCSIITAKVIEYLGSHFFDNDTLKNVLFGKGYSIKICEFKNAKFKSNSKVKFDNHIVALIELQNKEYYVFDYIMSTHIPIKFASFKKYYSNMLKNNESLNFEIRNSSQTDDLKICKPLRLEYMNTRFNYKPPIFQKFKYFFNIKTKKNE